MKHEYKKWILLALFTVVCIEILIVNIYLSNIANLRNTRIPAAKKTYNECHTMLEEIKVYQDKSGGNNKGQQGVPQQGQFKEWAQKAGITTAPEVRQYPARNAKGESKIHISDINVREVKGPPLFAFLKILEETGGNNRIKELFITEQRGKSNTFIVRVLFATYLRSENVNPSVKKNNK